MLELGFIVFGMFALFFLIIGYLVKASFDWTEEKELLIWWTDYDWITGRSERKYFRIFKL
jgi:hypothetical protein